MDITKLLNALDNESNEKIVHLSTKKIAQINLKILKQLHLDNKTTIEYLNKLKGYIYIDEMSDLKYGAFIKWIPLTNPEYLPLNYSGMICDIKIVDTGVFITCKNFMHRHYTFKMDECLIFQKLSSQEQIIIHALDHLEMEKEKESEENSDSDDS